ncbi:NADH-ubiquinone oxidoreductase chain J [hydrothermal vent metagenome]|uniref:NADH-ubiquinone oxidoreductase chain J n=1 Tax=hydrothermal vent metagenome TaxID=652676 RepID=A0A3B0TKI3_9ZZZZ
MALASVFFYLFAATMLGSALMVIASRNPVHSVLFLILTFINAAGLFIIVGAEFLAMILIIVYVGAVAVLFLFVVMMLDIDFTELREGFLEYLPVGGVVGLILLIELIMVFSAWVVAPGATSIVAKPIPAGGVTNTEALGRLLYTDYVYYFQAAGMVLLVAMIGAIVLTLHHRPNVKRQDISDQVARDPKAAVSLHDIKPGQGISS